jgi:hypothetical protein
MGLLRGHRLVTVGLNFKTPTNFMAQPFAFAKRLRKNGKGKKEPQPVSSFEECHSGCLVFTRIG